MDRVAAAGARHARDDGLDPQAGDLGLVVAHLAVDLLGPQRAVPARLPLAQEAVLLRPDAGQPLDVGDAVPAGHDEAQGEALVAGERLAVERVGQQRIRRQRVGARHAARERLIDRVGLPAEVDHLLAVVRAEEDHLAGQVTQADVLEHGAQPDAGPAAVAGQPLNHAGAVAGAFEAGDGLVAAHAAQVGEGELRGPLDQAADLQAERVRRDLRLVEVLDGVEVVAGREGASDCPDVEDPPRRSERPAAELVRHVRERHELLALGQGRQGPLGPSEHAHPGGGEAALQ